MPRLARFPEFLHRFNPAIALVSTFSLLVCGVTACEVTPEPELDAIADADTDSGQFRSIEQVAAQISVDSRFHTMLEKAVELTEQRLAAQAQTSDEDLDAFVQTIGNYPTSVEVDLDELATAAGMDAALIEDEIALANALISDYDLGGYTSQQIQDVFSMAASSSANQQYLLTSIQQFSGSSTQQCESVCYEEFAAEVATATAVYLTALAVTGVGVITIIAATAAYTAALLHADLTLKDCLAVCNGDTPVNECYEDSDCANDEFCWKGVLGLGDNECRDQKSQGDTCSRHGQCLSGCCKLHFMTNPFSKTCRPADACD